MIEIDGSAGEGGGQVVRTAVSLAAITGKSVEIVRVRERRERPGLQPQHLAAVRAAAAICNATTIGDRVGSDHVVFEPGSVPVAGDYVFDIRTAGAATLVLQTVLVPLLLADGDSTIEVIGGTHQPMSPAADYLEHVYAPALARFGAHVAVEYGPAGYYPRGGGRVRALVTGGGLRASEFTDRGARVRLDAYVVTSRLPDHVAERGAATLAELLPDADVRHRSPHAFSPGAGITVVALQEGGYGGFSSIGRPGLPIEQVATDAVRQFLAWDATPAACDEHLADQLVLPASVARGRSSWTAPHATEHLTTILGVAERFVPMSRRLDGRLVEVAPN